MVWNQLWRLQEVEKTAVFPPVTIFNLPNLNLHYWTLDLDVQWRSSTFCTWQYVKTKFVLKLEEAYIYLLQMVLEEWKKQQSTTPTAGETSGPKTFQSAKWISSINCSIDQITDCIISSDRSVSQSVSHSINIYFIC